MNRTELLKIIYALQQNEESLRAENKRLLLQLDEKKLRLEQAESIAEAALGMNRVFECAEQAAQQYLDSIQETEKSAEDIIMAALRESDEILAAAEERIRQIDEECQSMREKATKDVQAQKAAFAASARRTLEKYPGLGEHMRVIAGQ